jgi:hypothetical protein
LTPRGETRSVLRGPVEEDSMPSDGEQIRLRVEERIRLQAEKRQVRSPMYELDRRLKSGDESARAALEDAIRRSDEIEAQIDRIDREIRSLEHPNLGNREDAAVMYGPPAPMYGPPAGGGGKPRGLLGRLFRRK